MFKHCWVDPLFCECFGGSAWFQRYRVFNFELGVHGFEGTGYLVSRVLGTRFQGYRGTGGGYIVADYSYIRVIIDKGMSGTLTICRINVQQAASLMPLLLNLNSRY